MSQSFYKPDLAYIHDVGFGGPALRWAPAVLSILKSHWITRGLIVELGCGSGLLAETLSRSGYQVLGIDSSAAFISLARERVPGARFRKASLFQTEIPRCAAVVSTGEVLNYLFDSRSSRHGLATLFRRIYASLEPGGMLLFDMADPGQVPPGRVVRGFMEGAGWVVLVEKNEDHRTHVLTRRITTFRQAGKHWRRGEETHRQRLYGRGEVLRMLKAAGFQAWSVPRRQSLWLPPVHTAFVAWKRAGAEDGRPVT